MRSLILPNQLDDGLDPNNPFFFFVGPVLGGGDWQRRACELIWREIPDAVIAVPCRWHTDHPLYKHRIEGPEDAFENQTRWERHYLRYAADTAKKGCILGWLPREDKENPRNDGEPYGRDSYGEVGEWRGRLIYHPSSRFVLGVEPGFPGRRVMKRNFEEELEWFRILDNLEQTVALAIQNSTRPPATQ